MVLTRDKLVRTGAPVDAVQCVAEVVGGWAGGPVSPVTALNSTGNRKRGPSRVRQAESSRRACLLPLPVIGSASVKCA
jgi:hypothetical protein